MIEELNSGEKMIEEIISGDKIMELQAFLKVNGINTISTINTSFREVEQMKIPVLQYSVLKKAIHCFKFLLLNGCDPTKVMEEIKPEIFIINGRQEKLKRYEWDCMATAIYLGKIEIVTILEEKGIEKWNIPAHLEAAILSFRNEIAEELIEEMEENKKNHETIIQTCLNKGILAAFKNNNIQGTKLLIKKGADINVKDIYHKDMNFSS